MAPPGARTNQIVRTVAILFTVCWALVGCIPADYAQKRAAFIATEQALRTGGTGSDLTPDEHFVNNLLMKEKSRLIEAARLNGSDFPVRHNFLNQTAKAAMEATQAFQIIKKMPKGGALHLHDESITSIDWLVKNVTYRDHCYMCVDSVYNVKFHFFQSPPSNPGCPWKLVQDMRKEFMDVDAFDQSLQNNISLVTEDPAKAYPDINSVWKKFMDYFSMVEGLVLYTPVFEDYFRMGLQQFWEDNVQYMEIRVLLQPLYELNGTEHDSDWVLGVYRRVLKEFQQQHPDFTGVRLIKSSIRFKPSNVMLLDVKEAMRQYQENPGFVLGFDLVGQEDPLHPLIYYIDDLLYPSRQDPPVHLPYFFHAGETDWQETATDYNLVDALLLNTTRIGHGYALHKHPYLMERVRQADIAIEVNPISNQVLMLVDDPRNHPAAALIAQNFPVVISSDDNGAWGADPLSHDLYITFMALTGEDAGLSTLKQLALNSLHYSGLSADEKQMAILQWKTKWNQFIQNIVQETMNMVEVKPTGDEHSVLVG